MNTPKHATDPEIAALFEMLEEIRHDPFEQRRKLTLPREEPRTLTTVETKEAQNG